MKQIFLHIKLEHCSTDPRETFQISSSSLLYKAMGIYYSQICLKRRGTAKGQSGKIKRSMDSPYEMEATENEESEKRERGPAGISQA